MDDGSWTEAKVSALHRQVRDELVSVFDHDEAVSHSLLTKWLAVNPRFSADAISHEGPFNMALRIHYTVVEGGDPTGTEFIEWRKRYHRLWERRSEPQLSPAQEALLRERGWDGS